MNRPGRWIAIAALLGAVGFAFSMPVLPGLLMRAGMTQPAATAISFKLTAFIAPIGFLAFSFIGFGFEAPHWMSPALFTTMMAIVGSVVNGISWAAWTALVLWARVRERLLFGLLLALPVLYWCGIAYYLARAHP